MREKAESITRIPAFNNLPSGTETVLVVEDEPTVKNITIRMLKRLGYRVLHSNRGRDAIHLAERYDGLIDLLMTDVIMPLMNGQEVSKIIQGCRPKIKVLYTSGYPEDIITDHGILKEGIEFIGKPYTLQDLALKIRKVLDG